MSFLSSFVWFWVAFYRGVVGALDELGQWVFVHLLRAGQWGGLSTATSGWWSAAQRPRGGQSLLVDAAGAQCWVQHHLTSSLMTRVIGVLCQQVCRWQRSGRRGPWAGRRNGPTGTWWSSAKGSAKKWPQAPQQAGANLREGPEGLAEHQVDQEPATCPGGRGGQQPPELH